MSCLPARLSISVEKSPSAVRLPFSKFSGGLPHDGVNPGQLLGFALWFDWVPGQEPYTLDVILDDVSFE